MQPHPTLAALPFKIVAHQHIGDGQNRGLGDADDKAAGDDGVQIVEQQRRQTCDRKQQQRRQQKPAPPPGIGGCADGG